MLTNLENKLEHVEVSDGPVFEFVPQIHVHSDLNKWFCKSFQAMYLQDSVKVRSLANAMRKGIWDTIQKVEPVLSFDDQEFESDKVRSLVKEMRRIMKFRVVSYQRTTKKVVTYTRSMIEKARTIATQIMKKQDKLSKHIHSSAITLKQEKLNQLPQHVESTIVVDDPSFGQAFKINAQGESQQQIMTEMKKKASSLYKKLSKLQQERIHAVLQHDKMKVKEIDMQTKKIKTQTRALMGARQYLASLSNNFSFDNNNLNESIEDSLSRLEAGLSNKNIIDHELFAKEIEHEIDQHSNGLALFLGLQTQNEIMHLKKDLIKEVCTMVSKLFEEGKEEIFLINQEISTFYRELIGHPNAIKYLELLATKYRADIAKVQVQLLTLFDKR